MDGDDCLPSDIESLGEIDNDAAGSLLDEDPLRQAGDEDLPPSIISLPPIATVGCTGDDDALPPDIVALPCCAVEA